MAVKDYSDPRWQKVRLEIMNRDNFQCQSCGSTADTLHVHHRVYVKKKKIWDAEHKDLVTLCEKCHERAEQIVCGFREIADRIVHMEMIGSMPFRIDDRFHDMIASKSSLIVTGEYMNFCMNLLDSVTARIVISAESFEKEGAKS